MDGRDGRGRPTADPATGVGTPAGVRPERSASADLVPLEMIQAAAQRIRGTARVTPVLDLSLTEPCRWALKCESLQVGGAFKIRGAYNLVATLSEAARSRGLITFSSGNHGQAVALAARRVGVPAVVVMPTTVPRIKLETVRALGAEVILHGTTTLDRRTRGQAEAAARDLTIIPPFDDDAIIAGQGTVGLEVLTQCPEVSRVLVPIGGGGLIAGVSAVVKHMRPSVRVVGVEPAGAARMTASLEAGHPVTLSRAESVADGLLAVRPGDRTFAHVRTFVDEIRTVDDHAIAKAVVWLFRRARLVVEPSGAATVAALLQEAVEARGPTEDEGMSVAVVSGGNIDPTAVAAFAARVEGATHVGP